MSEEKKTKKKIVSIPGNLEVLSTAMVGAIGAGILCISNMLDEGKIKIEVPDETTLISSVAKAVGNALISVEDE